MQLPNTFTLFMYLLLSATHIDRRIGTPTGIVELKRGQYISGRDKLAALLRQTPQKIRTSLERLVQLEILSISVTNRFSIYTIVNYDIYQDDNTELTSSVTNRQPTDNQQITTKQTQRSTVNKKTTTSSGKPDQHRLNGDARLAAKRLLIFLNEKTGKNFQPVETNLKIIMARLSQYDEQLLRGVIVDRAERWIKDDDMREFLRPATLFADKNCAQYIGELPQ